MSGHIINPEAVGDPNQTPRVQLRLTEADEALVDELEQKLTTLADLERERDELREELEATRPVLEAARRYIRTHTVKLPEGPTNPRETHLPVAAVHAYEEQAGVEWDYDAPPPAAVDTYETQESTE